MIDTPACQWYLERLPYTGGQLSISERALITEHLRICDACRREAAIWENIADAVAEQYHDLHPVVLPDDAWDALSTRLVERRYPATPMPAATSPERLGTATRITALAALARMQTRLISKEVWALPTLTLFVAWGLLFAPWPWHDRDSALISLSALLGSAAVVLLYNRENDTGRELTLTTRMRPTSILLLRLGIFITYQSLVNLVAIAMFASAGFRFSAGWLFTSWLAPLSCLAAVSLLVASVAPTVVALVTCVGLWALRMLAGLPTFHAVPAVAAYEEFWHSWPLLGVATLAALTATLLFLERRERLA